MLVLGPSYLCRCHRYFFHHRIIFNQLLQNFACVLGIPSGTCARGFGDTVLSHADNGWVMQNLKSTPRKRNVFEISHLRMFENIPRISWTVLKNFIQISNYTYLLEIFITSTYMQVIFCSPQINHLSKVQFTGFRLGSLRPYSGRIHFYCIAAFFCIQKHFSKLDDVYEFVSERLRVVFADLGGFLHQRYCDEKLYSWSKGR